MFRRIPVILSLITILSQSSFTAAATMQSPALSDLPTAWSSRGLDSGNSGHRSFLLDALGSTPSPNSDVHPLNFCFSAISPPPPPSLLRTLHSPVLHTCTTLTSHYKFRPVKKGHFRMLLPPYAPSPTPDFYFVSTRMNLFPDG